MLDIGIWNLDTGWWMKKDKRFGVIVNYCYFGI
jgi:hypothetical protein